MTGSDDKTTRLWDSATGQPLGPFKKHPNEIHAVAFAPDGKIVATAGADRVAHLWNSETWEPIGVPVPHKGDIVCVEFVANGRGLVTSSRDHTGRLWHAVTGEPIGPPLEHQQVVNVIVSSPDGKFVLTASDDHTAQLWVMPSPVEGDFEALKLWVQVITALTMDDHGTISPLTEPIWSQFRKALSSLRPDYGSDEGDHVANRRVEDEKQRIDVWARVEELALDGDWVKSAETLQKALDDGYFADDSRIWTVSVYLWSFVQEMDHVRANCHTMLERFGNTYDPAVAHHVVTACLYINPEWRIDSQMERLAEVASRTGGLNNRDMGLLHLRRHEYATAEPWLERANRGYRIGRVFTMYFLAICRHNDGQIELAQQTFDEAEELRIDIGDSANDLGRRWYNWALISTVRREAISTLGLPFTDQN